MPLSRDELIKMAESQTKHWPQYRSHWDGPGWIRVMIKKSVKTKMGLHAQAGDVVIARCRGNMEGSFTERFNGKPCWTFYSWKTQGNVGIPDEYIDHTWPDEGT